MQPRWGNRVGLTRVTQGTRRCREPWAWESNAVGVGAIGRRVRSEGRDGREGPDDQSWWSLRASIRSARVSTLTLRRKLLEPGLQEVLRAG